MLRLLVLSWRVRKRLWLRSGWACTLSSGRDLGHHYYYRWCIWVRVKSSSCLDIVIILYGRNSAAYGSSYDGQDTVDIREFEVDALRTRCSSLRCRQSCRTI